MSCTEELGRQKEQNKLLLLVGLFGVFLVATAGQGTDPGLRHWGPNADPQNAPFKSWAEISVFLPQPQWEGKMAPPREALENGPRSRDRPGCCLCDAVEAPDSLFFFFFFALFSSCGFLVQFNSNNPSHCAYSCVAGPGLGSQRAP